MVSVCLVWFSWQDTGVTHQTRPAEFGGWSFEIPKWPSLPGGRVWWEDSCFEGQTFFLQSPQILCCGEHKKEHQSCFLSPLKFSRLEPIQSLHFSVGNGSISCECHKIIVQGPSLVGGRVWWEKSTSQKRRGGRVCRVAEFGGWPL